MVRKGARCCSTENLVRWHSPKFPQEFTEHHCADGQTHCPTAHNPELSMPFIDFRARYASPTDVCFEGKNGYDAMSAIDPQKKCVHPSRVAI